MAKESVASLRSATLPPSQEELLAAVALDVQALAQQRKNPLGEFRPRSGQQVLDILRWAETRGMSSSHIRISSGRDKGVEGWGAMLASRGTFACSIQSLSELPAALGGGRV